MKMAPGAIPNPGRVPKHELLSPELWLLVVVELGYFSGEIDQVLRVFGSKTNL